MNKSLLVGVLIGIAFSIVGFGGYLFFVDDDPEQESSSVESEVDSTQGATDQQDKLLFTNVYRGDGTRNKFSETSDEPTSFIVNSKSELDTVWFELFKVGLAAPKPTVNFENQSVIVSMLDRKEKGEYQITVQDLKITNNELVISAQEKKPGSGCPSRISDSRPMHIVITQKLSTNKTKLSLTDSFAAPCKIELKI